MCKSKLRLIQNSTGIFLRPADATNDSGTTTNSDQIIRYISVFSPLGSLFNFRILNCKSQTPHLGKENLHLGLLLIMRFWASVVIIDFIIPYCCRHNYYAFYSFFYKRVLEFFSAFFLHFNVALF